MKLTRFEDIEAWQEARKLTKMVYDITIGSTLKKEVLHSFPWVIQYIVVLTNDPDCVGTRAYRSSPPQ